MANSVDSEPGSSSECGNTSAYSATTTSITTPSTNMTSSVEPCPLRTPSENSSVSASYRSSQCSKHNFEAYPEELGCGTFGIVFKVRCRDCHMDAARKDIRLHTGGDIRLREKRIQAMKDELDFLSHLDHPNIIQYLSHDNQSNGLPRIYTEFCEYRDLERHIRIRQDLQSSSLSYLHVLFSELGIWSILRQLASALAKCHHGLSAIRTKNGFDEFTSFDASWTPIVHRDIKPGNIFLKLRAQFEPPTRKGDCSTKQTIPEEIDMICVKLGDFGTACTLGEGDVRSTIAGTKEFWAPEIVKQSEERLYRITSWSVKSDIWSVGVIMYNFLVGKFPSVNSQPSSWQERVQKMTQRVTSRNHESYEAPDILIKVICECLDPEPSKRATALEILSLALKTDTSEAGLRRSESFWKALSMLPPEKEGLAAKTVRHFVTEYLNGIDDVPFSPTEACYILSLQSLFMGNNVAITAPLFHNRFYGDLEGASIYHAIAVATSQDEYLRQLVWDQTKWPWLPGLVQMSLRKDNKEGKGGRLPSTLAAYYSNHQVAHALSEIEDTARSQQRERAMESMKEAVRKEMMQAIDDEVGFLFQVLTGKSQNLSIKREIAERALVTAASLGYHATTRKFVENGVSASAIVGHRRETALHFAARAGNEPLIKFLVEKGANLQSGDYHGTVALHCAAWSGHHGAVRTLMSLGADVNAQDDRGRTALFGAAGGGHLAVVRALLARGADRNIRGGNKRQTALERAEAREHRDIVLELRDPSSDTYSALVRLHQI